MTHHDKRSHCRTSSVIILSPPICHCLACLCQKCLSWYNSVSKSVGFDQIDCIHQGFACECINSFQSFPSWVEGEGPGVSICTFFCDQAYILARCLHLTVQVKVYFYAFFFPQTSAVMQALYKLQAEANLTPYCIRILFSMNESQQANDWYRLILQVHLSKETTYPHTSSASRRNSGWGLSECGSCSCRRLAHA